MTLAAQITADLAALFNTSELAQSITYNGSTIAAQVSFLESYDEQSGSVLEQARIWVKVSDVASPTYRDPAVIGSDTWYVRQVEKGDAFVWTLLLQRDERPKI